MHSFTTLPRLSLSSLLFCGAAFSSGLGDFDRGFTGGGNSRFPVNNNVLKGSEKWDKEYLEAARIRRENRAIKKGKNKIK